MDLTSSVGVGGGVVAGDGTKAWVERIGGRGLGWWFRGRVIGVENKGEWGRGGERKRLGGSRGEVVYVREIGGGRKGMHNFEMVLEGG